MRAITAERLAWVNTSGMKLLLYPVRGPGYSFGTMIVPLSKVQLRQDEDGVWIARSTLLPGCHAHGRDRGEATLRFQQAAKAHLEALLDTGRPIPPAFRDKFVLTA
jgi:predicted RNase H-like HicB family nuclease